MRSDPGAPSRPGQRHVAAAALIGVVAGVIPVHLTGAVAPDVQDALGFGDAALGMAVAAFFAVSALGTGIGGGWADRAGPRRAMRASGAVAAVGLAGMAIAPSYVLLLLALVITAPANAVAQPAANVLVADGVQPHRRGIALGVKQSAIAASTATSGVFALLFVPEPGWRWAYAAAAALAVTTILLIPEVRPGGRPVVAAASRTEDDAVHAPTRAEDERIVLLARAAGFCGAAAAASIGAFLVRSAEESGLSDSTGRIVLVIGSVILVVARVLWGWAADRGLIDPIPTVTRLLLAGTVGYVGLASGTEVGFWLGALAAFAAGWSWPGLLVLGLVRRFPTAPGSPTGRAQQGFFAGAVIGPLAFGLLAEHVSFAAAWASAAGWGLAAAVGTTALARALAAEAR